MTWRASEPRGGVTEDPEKTEVTATFTFGDVYTTGEGDSQKTCAKILCDGEDELEDEQKATVTCSEADMQINSTKGNDEYTYVVDTKGYSSRGFAIYIPEGAENITITILYKNERYDGSTVEVDEGQDADTTTTRTLYLSKSTTGTDGGEVIVSDTRTTKKEDQVRTVVASEDDGLEAGQTYYLFASDSVYVYSIVITYTI